MNKRSPKSSSQDKSGTLPRIDVDSPTSTSGRTLQASVSEPWINFSAGQPRHRQTARERIKAFTERNNPMHKDTPNERFEGRLSYAKLQRELALANKAHDDAGFLGAKGIQGFKTYLRTRFGSIVAGWRQLDADKNGRLTYYEFINSCRRMGYHGNLKALWSELDANQNGTVSLMEIDSEVGHYVGTFKLALIKKYGDVLTGWQKGLDTNKTGRIEQKEVDACCARLGLTLDTKKLFNMLTVGPTSLGMTLQDFDPEAYNRWLSGDVKGLSASQADTEFLDDLDGTETLPEDALQRRIVGGARKWRQEVITKDRTEVKAERDRDAKLRCGLHTVAGFKQALIVRCGSLYRAWREALDLDGNERIAFHEFSQALHRLGFHGNVKGLWAELAPKKVDHIVFADLDPQTDALLKELRGKFVAEYGNILLGWLKGLDCRGTGMVTEQQFVQACTKLGFSGDAKDLFRVLQPDLHRNFLTVKDFDTKACLALSRGDFRMISEPEETTVGNKRPTELSFSERQYMCFNYQIQRAWQVAKREEFAKACRVAVPPHLTDTTEEFEYLCIRTYGSLIGAWRLCLDLDGNGKLTFGEFCKALRRLGFGGDYQALFKRYDKDQKHFIRLKDLDPEADEIITSFLALLGSNFGELDNAWRLGFKKDPHDSIDEEGLRKACEAMGYSHDVQKLFRCLQPVPGRQLITIWDLDPECTRKKQRGDKAFITKPKSPISTADQRSHSAFEFVDSQRSTACRSSPTKTNNSIEASIEMLNQLRRVLKNKYGSTAVAWKLALDPNFVGTTSFGRFNLILDDCAFKGNRKAIWQELLQKQPQKRTHINFQDIDPDAQAMLDSARNLLLDRFGSLREAWRKGLDTEKIERLCEEEFLKAWEVLGLQHTWSAKKLFELLLGGRHPRMLIWDDLELLLIGVLPPERVSMRDGASGSMTCGSAKVRDSCTEHPSPRSASVRGASSTLQGRDSSPSRSEFEPSMSLTLPWSPKAARQYDLKFPAADINKTNQKHHEQDVIVSSLTQFKQMIKHKYGSIFSAWRNSLDADHNGVVTLKDFSDACRNLGAKAIQKIWMELDVDAKGQVSLKDLDLPTWEAFSSLDGVLREQYKSTKLGWKHVFDSDKKVFCDEAKFVAGCEKLGLEQDAVQLFKLLRPEPGRPYLNYTDLWDDVDNSNPIDTKTVKLN